jgi:phosphoglucosamine mutase
MSNFGLDESLRPHGGKVLRTAVGDRYVIEAIVRENLNIDGEQSGHMIFRDFGTSGDDLVAALQILRTVVETGRPLSEPKRCLSKYPQAQRNLRVKTKPHFKELPDVLKLIETAERELEGQGRVLLRYSGTEPKVRLLIEGRDAAHIDAHAHRIADALKVAMSA